MVNLTKRMGWACAAAVAFLMVGAMASAQEGGQRRQAPPRGEAKVEIEGQTITVDYGRPSTEGAGYKQLTTVKEGFVWRMGSNKATKLVTPVDLKFGDTTVKAGSYSLWAKRVGDSWHLLFNTNADVWGTMYKKEADVAEVPLKKSTTEEPAKLMTIELGKTEDGQGEFKLIWGPDVGTAKFTVAK